MRSVFLFDLLNPFVLFNLISLASVAAVSVVFLFNDRSRNKIQLTGLLFAFSLWLLFSTLEYSAPDLAGTILSGTFSYFGITMLPV